MGQLSAAGAASWRLAAGPGSVGVARERTQCSMLPFHIGPIAGPSHHLGQVKWTAKINFGQSLFTRRSRKELELDVTLRKRS